jgi:drug/metabolite transporter (DMT)-like permease
VATALLFSTGGAAIKFSHLSAWQVSCYRSGVASVLLFALFPEARRGISRRVWLTATFYAATLICYVLATRLTTAANAIYLQSAAPLYLVLLSPLVLRERVGRRDYAFVAIIFCGLLLVLSGATPGSTSAPDPLHGNMLGAACGVFWALTLLSMRVLGRSGEAGAASYAVPALGNLIACLACLVPASLNPAPGLDDWLVVLYLGVFNVALAFVCLSRGIRHLTAVETSVILLLEPALNPVWTWLISGERPSRLAMAGGVLIMLATGLRILLSASADVVSQE